MNSTTSTNNPSPTLAAAKGAATALKDKVVSSADSLKSSALDQAANRKADVADNIGRVSGALHETAENVAPQDPNIAHFAHRIAERLDGASSYLRNRSLTALKDDACRVAREHPVAFFGGLFAAGLIFGSLIKAGVSEAAGNAVATDTNGNSPAPSESIDTSSPQTA